MAIVNMIRSVPLRIIVLLLAASQFPAKRVDPFSSHPPSHCEYQLEIAHVQDVTGSMGETIEHIFRQTHVFLEFINSQYPGSRLALATFKDKPLPTVGDWEASFEDGPSHCFRVASGMDNSTADYFEAFARQRARGGNDWKGGQLEALVRLLTSPRVGFSPPEVTHDPVTRRPILRCVIFSTDSLPHLEGDAQDFVDAYNAKTPSSIFQGLVLSPNDILQRPQLVNEDEDFGCGSMEYPPNGGLGEAFKRAKVTPIFVVSAGKRTFSRMPDDMKLVGQNRLAKAIAAEYERLVQRSKIDRAIVIPLEPGVNSYSLDVKMAIQNLTLGNCPPPLTTESPAETKTDEGTTRSTDDTTLVAEPTPEEFTATTSREAPISTRTDEPKVTTESTRTTLTTTTTTKSPTTFSSTTTTVCTKTTTTTAIRPSVTTTTVVESTMAVIPPLTMEELTTAVTTDDPESQIITTALPLSSSSDFLGLKTTTTATTSKSTTRPFLTSGVRSTTKADEMTKTDSKQPCPCIKPCKLDCCDEGSADIVISIY